MISRSDYQSEKGVKLSGSKCVICGWTKRDINGALLVEGAHVRQFKNVFDYDKADNIIGLCPNHHTEYDRGILTIDPDKKVYIHYDPNDEFFNKKLIGSISHIQRGYFAYHIKHVFKGKYRLD